MTIHKLKRPIPFFYYLLCRPGTNDLIDRKHQWSWLWRKVTCAECRKLGGRG